MATYVTRTLLPVCVAYGCVVENAYEHCERIELLYFQSRSKPFGITGSGAEDR